MNGESTRRTGACAGWRRLAWMLAVAGLASSARGGDYRSVLECAARSPSWATGAPVEVRLTVVPAARTDQALRLGGARGGAGEPLSLGAGMGVLVWDDGVLGPRRDRAVQLTQPTDRRPARGEPRMPLVILGFRAAPSGSIPLLLHVDVHAPGKPFRAWLPGREALVEGGCRVR